MGEKLYNRGASLFNIPSDSPCVMIGAMRFFISTEKVFFYWL